MKNVLVTGGAGFIGSSLVRRLVDEKYKVTVFDNQSRGSIEKLSGVNNFKFINGDIREYETVLKATKNIDTIIHLASINGTKYFYEKPDLVLSVGIEGMINVLNASKENKVKNLFFASSSEVYQTPSIIPTPEDISFSIPDPLNPRYSYAGAKITSELLAIHLGTKFLEKVVIFRPHNVYGPNMGNEHVVPELINNVIKSKNNRLKIQGTGQETRAFIYIDDFTDAFMLVFKKGKNKQIYNIGTNEEISIKQLISSIERAADKKLTIIPSKLKTGGTLRRCPDITKIKKLGFKQKTSLDTGISKTFMWYNDQK